MFNAVERQFHFLRELGQELNKHGGIAITKNTHSHARN